MTIIYRAPIYTFLQYLKRHDVLDECGKSVLDCGAGGRTPALGLFHELGFQTAGIDISDEQITLATKFEHDHHMNLHIQKGDMRAIPFPDAHFDIVYELYSMVHLTKADIRQAMAEMKRVLKPGGYCYLSFMSSDCFPMIGKEGAPGEFHGLEHGHQVVHSTFSDAEAMQFCTGWKILENTKLTISNPQDIEDTSLQEWEQFFEENQPSVSKEEWMQIYPQRVEKWQFIHNFFILQKA